jgi:flagellar biosynthetic protein FliQ
MLIVTAVLALPILGLATLVGAAVAVVQAATWIQEQTLTLLRKVIVVGAVIALFGSFGMNLCAQLFSDGLARIADWCTADDANDVARFHAQCRADVSCAGLHLSGRADELCAARLALKKSRILLPRALNWPSIKRPTRR